MRGGRFEWERLQDRYRASWAAAVDCRAVLNAKYREHIYAGKGELARLDRLQRAKDRAAEACSKWLAKHCSWNWHSGTSAHWLFTRLTYEQAISQEKDGPELPQEAAGYGNVQRGAYRPGRG